MSTTSALRLPPPVVVDAVEEIENREKMKHTYKFSTTKGVVETKLSGRRKLQCWRLFAVVSNPLPLLIYIKKIIDIPTK